MSYLSRLKQLTGSKNFTHGPCADLTKPPKAPFVSSVSMVQGVYENISANNSGLNTPPTIGIDDKATHAGILERHPDAVAAEPLTPVDPEAWEERAAIAEFDGGLNRDAAEQLAWREDDRRTCTQCINLRQRACSIAKPERGAVVVANRGYRPDPARLLRCAGYLPMANDSDQRSGAERWNGL